MLNPANRKARPDNTPARLRRRSDAPAARAVRTSNVYRILLVLTLLPVVHWLGVARADDATPATKETATATSPARPPEKPVAEPKPLPPAVSEMRQTILEAVRTGRIEDLKIAIEWNELPPDFGAPQGEKPIEFLKKQSGDGEGREILAIIGKLLDLPPAQAPVGADVENNAIYVWPYLASLPLDKLDPADEVNLYRLMSPAEAKAMREKKKWTWWTIAIGADGTWHAFRKSE